MFFVVFLLFPCKENEPPPSCKRAAVLEGRIHATSKLATRPPPPAGLHQHSAAFPSLLATRLGGQLLLATRLGGQPHRASFAVNPQYRRGPCRRAPSLSSDGEPLTYIGTAEAVVLPVDLGHPH